MKTETIEYKDGDVTLRGYLAYDETKSGKRPGILVMPEALGLGTHAKSRAERLAQLGYVALAGDPYGNGLELATVQEAIKLATDLFADTAKARKRVRVALDKLASLPQVDASRLAEIGFCMGGTFGLELARDGAPLKGVVTFHSGLQTQRPAEPGKVTAKILVNTGADDPMVPFDGVKAFEEEMKKAGADWERSSSIATPSTALPIPTLQVRECQPRSSTTSKPTSVRGRRWSISSKKFSPNFRQLQKGEKHGGPDGRV